MIVVTKFSRQPDKLALSLPDIPRWVETRSMLLSGRCELFGLDETGASSFVVSSPELQLISVVGFAAKEAILKAVARNDNQGEILATLENCKHVSEAVPDWAACLAKLHVLENKRKLPEISTIVRLLSPSEIEALTNVPLELKEELTIACRYSPVAANIADGEPLSFCYAGSETERLWDISINTLAGYRKKGYAAACVTYMIELMNERNKQPVWGAYEDNEPSLRLAAKLGFVAVDKILVFQRK